VNTIVLVKLVPDLVEDLDIDPQSGLLDRTFLRLVPSELDEHALEEALLLKERHGGSVTVMTLDVGDVDEALYTAVAKGADRVIKIAGQGFDQGVSNHTLAALFLQVIGGMPFDLVLTGTQAVDDLDGFVGALFAWQADLPYVGYVTKVEAGDGKLLVRKEYSGGLNAEIEISPPAVMGIQAAEKPPRYVVTTKVMDAMKSGTIEQVEVGPVAEQPLTTARMSLPESGRHAQMIEGNAREVAEKLAKLLRDHGLVA